MKYKLKYHRLAYSFVIFILSFSTALRADRLPKVDERGMCNPEFNPDKTMLTIMGDSRGDWISKEAYGWFDWEFYLGLARPNVKWDVQKLAVESRRTRDVINELLHCAQNGQGTYKTAKNVVLEIGGNDYIDNVFWMTLMLWIYPRVQQLVLHNTRTIIKILKHPLYNKNVLMLGNLPSVTTSPTEGPATQWDAKRQALDFDRNHMPYENLVKGTPKNGSNRIQIVKRVPVGRLLI